MIKEWFRKWKLKRKLKKIDITGTFEIFGSKEDMMCNRNQIAKFHNKFVDSGKAFVVDFLFGNGTWLEGNWHTNRYVRVGTSSNTNTGVVGPSFTAPATYTNVAVDGSWQGVAENDITLSGDVTATPANIIVQRTGKTCLMYAIIDDSVVTDGITETYYLTEFGIFLGDTVPGNDPVQYPTADNRNNAMVVRAVNYKIDGDEYQVIPITKAPGHSIVIRYTFLYFEG